MKNWKLGFIGFKLHEADSGSNGGTGGNGEAGDVGGSGGEAGGGTPEIVKPEIYSDEDLTGVLSGIMNIEDRGNLALTMNNIRNTTNGLITERNDLKTKLDASQKELKSANEKIGALYSQLDQSETLGGVDNTKQTRTTRNLNDVRNQVIGQDY